MKKLIKLTSIVFFSVAFLSACNTVSGVGKDVSAAGNATGNALNNASNAVADDFKKATK